jgi:hypothetical protein
LLDHLLDYLLDGDELECFGRRGCLPNRLRTKLAMNHQVSRDVTDAYLSTPALFDRPVWRRFGFGNGVRSADAIERSVDAINGAQADAAAKRPDVTAIPSAFIMEVA